MNSEEKEMLKYAKDLLSDVRFESVISCMARHMSGDEGYHSVPQLFWGVLRHGETVEKKYGEDHKEVIKSPIDERLTIISDALDIIKDCTAILSTSVVYEKAIEAHRQLRQAGIDLDFVNSKSDDTNRLRLIEEKLDFILECMVVLTAEQVCQEVGAASDILDQYKKKK